MRKKKKEKMLDVFVIIPNDCEYSVQYSNTKEQADAMARMYESGAHVSFDKVPERIVDRKEIQTATRGYKV